MTPSADATDPDTAHALGVVVRLLKEAGLPTDPASLTRPLGAGRTLAGLLRAGMPPNSAVKPLMSLLRQDRAQRQALDQRLAERRKASDATLDDFGIPRLSED